MQRHVCVGLAVFFVAGCSFFEHDYSPEINAAKKIIDDNDYARIEEAGSKLKAVLAESPDNVFALTQFARYQLVCSLVTETCWEKGWNAAETTLLNAIKLNKQYPEAHVLLGHVLVNTNRAPEAINELDLAKKLGSTNPWLILNKADAVLNLRQDNGDRDSREQLRALYVESIESVRALYIAGDLTNKERDAALEFLNKLYNFTRNYTGIHWYNEQILRAGDFSDVKEEAWANGNYADTLASTIGDFKTSEISARKALMLLSYPLAKRTLALSLLGQWAEAPAPHTVEDGLYTEAVAVYPEIMCELPEYGAYVKTHVIFKALQEVGVDLDKLENEQGMNPIEDAFAVAVAAGHQEAFKSLAEMGMAIDYPAAKLGELSFLHWSIGTNDPALTKMLVDSGAVLDEETRAELSKNPKYVDVIKSLGL